MVEPNSHKHHRRQSTNEQTQPPDIKPRMSSRQQSDKDIAGRNKRLTDTSERSSRRSATPEPRTNVSSAITKEFSANDTRPDHNVKHSMMKSKLQTRRPSSTQLARLLGEMLPPGLPPESRSVSWAELLSQGDEHPSIGDNTHPPTGHELRASRQQDLANFRTDKRITNKNRLDMSIIGEFPVALLSLERQSTINMTSSSDPYLPNDVLQILPSQLAGPDDFFVPGPEFLRDIKTVMNRQPPPPLLPPFRFGTDQLDLDHNAQIMEAAGFDFERIIPSYQGSTLGFGSEFRPMADLKLLLSKHPHFPFVARILSEGMEYHYREGEELSESERLVELAGQLQRGNHKSVSQDTEKVRDLLSKDVKHGFTIPLPIDCAPQIKGAMIQPLGVVKQWSLNEKSERVEKFRLTQDLSFSVDSSTRDCSVNGRVDLQR